MPPPPIINGGGIKNRFDLFLKCKGVLLQSEMREKILFGIKTLDHFFFNLNDQTFKFLILSFFQNERAFSPDINMYRVNPAQGLDFSRRYLIVTIF